MSALQQLKNSSTMCSDKTANLRHSTVYQIPLQHLGKEANHCRIIPRAGRGLWLALVYLLSAILQLHLNAPCGCDISNACMGTHRRMGNRQQKYGTKGGLQVQSESNNRLGQIFCPKRMSYSATALFSCFCDPALLQCHNAFTD